MMNRPFRSIDWLAGSLAGAALLYLTLYFPFVASPRFQSLMHDFGSPLPFLTRLAITRWFAPVLSLPIAASLTLGLLHRRPPLLGAAFLLSIGSVGLCLYALYLPLLNLAGNIQ